MSTADDQPDQDQAGQEQPDEQPAAPETTDGTETPDMTETVENPEATEAAEKPDQDQAGQEQPDEQPIAPKTTDGTETPDMTETVENPEATEAAEKPEEPTAAPAEHAAPAEVELVHEGMGWYVLRVASNKEDQVREALERKVKIEQLEGHVGRVLVPAQREKRMRGGTARVYHRKLYPGYVFVEMVTDNDGRIPENVWFVIKETMGVGDFIGSGGKPSPMPMDDVAKMLAAAVKPEESPALADLGFKKDDKVKVTEGPFENFEGVVDEINVQKGTVKVIVTIFGRPTPVEIEYWQVEQL